MYALKITKYDLTETKENKLYLLDITSINLSSNSKKGNIDLLDVKDSQLIKLKCKILKIENSTFKRSNNERYISKVSIFLLTFKYFLFFFLKFYVFNFLIAQFVIIMTIPLKYK